MSVVKHCFQAYSVKDTKDRRSDSIYQFREWFRLTPELTKMNEFHLD